MFKIADEVDSMLSGMLDSVDESSEKKSNVSSEKYQLPVQVGIKNEPLEKGDKPWIVGHFAPGQYLNPTHPQGHEGVDLKAARGTPIYPLASGIVIDTNINEKGGKTCRIAYEGGNVISYFAHMDQVKVQPQQSVTKTTIVGLVGDTGNAKGRGAHLHYEVKVDGTKIDPLSVVGKTVGTLSKAKKVVAEMMEILENRFVKEAGILRVPEDLLKQITDYVLSYYCTELKKIMENSFEKNSKRKFNPKILNYKLIIKECNKYITPYKTDNVFINEDDDTLFPQITHKIMITIDNDIDQKISDEAIYYGPFFLLGGEKISKLLSGDFPSVNLPHEIKIKPYYDDILTVEDFNSEIFNLKRNILHELQHFVQVKIQVTKLLPEEGGLPPKKIRSKNEDPDGFLYSEEHMEDEEKHQAEHELRDAEFQPNLKDSIQDFIFTFGNYPLPAKEAAAKVWIGMPNTFNGKISETFAVNETFKMLMEKAPEKWKKAVKEFYKIVFED